MGTFNTENYLHFLASETARKYAFDQNTQEFTEWQKSFREELVNALGIPTIRQNGICPLNPTKLEEVDCGTYTREEWVITTEFDFEVTFFMLIPKNAGSYCPLVLTPHGHSINGRWISAGIWSNEGEREEIEGERDIAVQAVEEGYIAIAPDVRGFDLLRKDADKKNGKYSCRELQLHALMFNRTLIGERVWDTMRLIDFAETRPEIDTSKILITGNSGGGTISLYAAACDDRISASIPSSYFCTFQHSIGSMYHCECNYVPGIMTLGEMYDVAGLIAPRPFLAVCGKEDPIFPIEHATEAFWKTKRIYEAAGHPECCELFIGNGGHRYYKERVWNFLKEIAEF